MTFLDALRSIDRRTVWLVVLAVLPYVDQETLGVIPFLRDVVPGVDPIYTLQLDWSERGRLLVFILVPVLDGEILELLGVDLQEAISD